jgi:hypothetical protein
MLVSVEMGADAQETYVAPDVHVVCGFRIGPDHAVRRKERPHARRLPREQHGAILGRACEVGPRDGGGIAHDLRAAN